jgi:hypothetical protein
MSAALRLAAETRLAQLRQDLVTGGTQVTRLQETLLRIEGAVQILEEVLATPEPVDAPANGATPEETTPCPNPNAAAPTSSR